jgi:tetratricopeptide (TPR) repeat protein
MTRAFIVRPFGTKHGINFDEVQKNLIAPAFAACDIADGTTEPFVQAGNIRTDMFQQLLVADVVVADISIHNANVFYELGIRHALQPKRTLLLRAKSKKDPASRGLQDEVPFDLRTDRYVEYDSDSPGERVELLTEALRQTLFSEKPDSPVFQMLPDLEAQERSRFLPVPQAFRDDVERAVRQRQVGLLRLLGLEAQGFFWESEGLRLVGRAQFDLMAFLAAKETWEKLYSLEPQQSEANQRLAIIYQRLGDLDSSDRALLRVTNATTASHLERAEAFSLLGRNIKERWRSSWAPLSGAQAARKALQSPGLLQAYQKYREAFLENLDSFYPGLNALSLLTLAIELAKLLPDVWEVRFETEDQAASELDALEMQRQRLAGAVGLSLDVTRQRLQLSNREDRWVDISLADFLFLTTDKPPRVAFAYESALAGAPVFYSDSARVQLDLFMHLGVMTERAAKALEVLGAGVQPEPTRQPPVRVILFTGHMIDPAGTTTPRFPDSIRDRARQAILEKVQQEVTRTAGPVVAIASGASGGDLLFHDVCEELGIAHRLLLPLPPEKFRNESVSPAGRYWEDRFDAVLRKDPSSSFLTDSDALPIWLRVKKEYSTWQRANLWLVQEAVAIGAGNLTLIALWDGVKTEGIGGTYHMRIAAQARGAALVTIYTADLLHEGSTAIE